MNDADIDLSDIKKREPGAPAPGALAAPLDIDLSDVAKRDTTVQDNYRSVVDNKISPDHAAKVINISKVSGLPPELVASDVDTAQKAFDMPDFEVMKSHAPYTHDFLKDKGNMAMASDSIRNLVDIERTIKAHNAIQAFGAGFSSTGLGMALNRELPVMEIPEDASAVQKFAGMLGGFAGDFPAMVAGGIAGAVPAALSGPVAAPFVASAATFAAPAAFRQAMIEHYQNPDLDAAQLFKSAYSVGKEALKGAAVGALTATGAAAGARLVTGPAIKGAGFTMKAAVPAGKLTAAKTVGELAGMTVGGAAVEGELPRGEDIVGNAALVGLLHGVGAITGAVKNVRLAEMQAENTKAYLGRMRELVADTKLREIDAGAMNKILSDQASPVYVPVEAFNTLFQSKGVDPAQVAKELGISGSHAEALRTNGDVEIPMGTYMSKGLEPFHVELEKDVKVDPEHPTENQRINSAKELNDVAKDINGKAEKLFEEKPDTKAAYELIREDIVKRQDIFSDIKDKGAKKNAEQAADILAKYFTVQGDALGKDPLQVYEEKGLQMYGPEQQVNEMGLTQADMKRLTGTQILDKKGIPLRVFHGTQHPGFKEFSTEKMGERGTAEGKGFYFTDSPEVASSYGEKEGGAVYPVYLSIKKPMTLKQRNVSDAQLKSIFNELLKENPDALSNYGDVEYEGKAAVMKEAISIEKSNESDVDLFASMVNGLGDYEAVAKAFTKVTGYDGVINEGFSYGDIDKRAPSEKPGFNVYVAFHPDQIVNAIGVKDPRTLMQRDSAKRMAELNLRKNEILSRLADSEAVESDARAALEADRTDTDLRAAFDSANEKASGDRARLEEVDNEIKKIEGDRELFQRPGESLGKAEAPKSPEGLIQRPIEAPGTTNEKQVPMHKDVTADVAKMAKVIPQSLGAGRIPKPVVNAIESVAEAGQEMLERILSNPDIFPTVSGSPIKDNADYGPTFTPTNNCPKGEKLTKNVLAVRDFLDQKLEGKDAKEKSNIKTAAARKLLAAGVAQGLETPCLQCYTVEKQLIGYSAKPFSLGQKMYEHGQIDSSVDFLKSHGSILRGYGTADFTSSDIPSIIKLGQDLAAHKIGAGFYTKSLWMPEIFGDTGMKFNISVGEHLHVGIPVEVAKAYRERYKNVGIVAIAINEAQVKKFGENPDVDLIIPTHLGGGTPADFLSDITGMKWESFTREQGEKITVDGKSVGLNSPTANGIKNIEKARDMVKKGSYNRDKAEYLAAIEKAKALTGVEISPKFPDYVKEKWYGKLIGTGPGEYGKTADLPQIDMSKMNLDKAREYFMTASEDKTALDNKYASMARTIAKEGMKGGVEAINALNPKTLYQAFTPAREGGKSEPLASYTKTQEGSIIKMFKGANASSFIHEIGHFILEDVKKVAESGQAPAEYAAEWKTIQAYLSHESGKEISVEQHERFAQSFEKYIMEGVAPIPELKTSFQKMRDWMLQVYDGVKRKLGVEITPEIRGVFDRLLAGKEAIDAAKAEMGPDSEIASLKGDALRARQMAEEMLIKPVMAQLSADNKAKMEQERIIAQAEAIVEVDKLPVYSAIKDLEGIAFLKEQRLTEQMIRNEADKYVQGELSEERVSLFDSVAQLNGFSSGDELLKKIYTSDTRDAARAKLVEEKMSKFEKVNTAALKEEALKVLHTGDNMGKLIALESQVLEGMRMSKEISAEITKARRELASQEWEQAKAQAAETLGNDKEWKKAIKFRLYYTLERKAAEQSAKLLANKDIEGAMKAKREQLVSHAFAAEALRLKDRTARNIKFLEGQQSADKTSFKKEEHFLQVAALLNRFGLKREDFKQEDRGESLSQWVERAALHYGEIVSAIPAWLQNEAISKDINSLTANQLKDLRDTVAHIRHIANNENSVFKGERRTTLDALAGELHSSQLESGNFGKIAKTSSAESWADKIIKGKDWVRNEMISVETLMRKLDGYKNNGVWWKSLFEGYAESADGRAMDMVQTAEKQAKMWEAYTAKERETMDSRKLYVPEFGVSLTKTEIMTIALNWGNAMNKQRLLEGSGGYQDSRGKMWTEKDVQAVLDREMSKRDWDTVQETWNLVNSFWPRIAEMYKRITGFEPGKISAEPLTTPHGVYEGGYFPLRRDTRLDVRGNEQMKTDEMLGDIPAWRASTKNGFIESRVRGAVYPVSLDIRGVSKHLTDVIHDLNLREWVLDSNRILGNKEVQVSLQDALGMEGYRVVKDWVKDVANTKGYESFDPLLREIRRRTIISTLGLRLSSVILQADDISAYGRIDPKNFGVTSAIAAISSHYSKIVTRMETQKEAVDFVYSKSKYMKFERGENLDRDVSEASKRSFGKDDKLGKAAMYFVTSADHILSIPVWKEAYKVGLKLNSGNEKLAVSYADSIIRRAQSSGRLGEMPKIMRGGEFQKALTMFYSFVSKRANIWYEQIDKTRSLSDVPELVGTAAALWVLPSLFSALVHDGLPTDEKKKKKYIKELLMYPFSLFPVVRDISDFAMDKAMGLPGFGYGVTPLTRGVDVLGDLITKMKSPKKGPQDKLEAVSHAASIATPYPDQINAWVFNVADYASGKMSPEPRDIMKRRPVRERR